MILKSIQIIREKQGAPEAPVGSRGLKSQSRTSAPHLPQGHMSALITSSLWRHY